MQWQDRKAENMCLLHPNQRHQKEHFTSVSMPISPSQRQPTHLSTPRAYGDFPAGMKDDSKSSSLEGAVDAFDLFAMKTSPWTETAGERSSNCLEKESIGILNDSAWSEESRSPSPNYCYSTAMDCRSTTADSSHSYQPYNDISTKSYRLADHLTSGESDPRHSGVSDLSSRCRISTATKSRDAINITSVLKNSEQESIDAAPFLSWTNEESDSMNFAASESTKTDNALTPSFETRLEEIFANYSTGLVRNSIPHNDFGSFTDKAYMSNREFLQESLPDLPLGVLNFPSHVDLLDTTLFPEYVFPDTTNLQSAPSSLSSNEPSEDQQWDFKPWLHSSDQLSTPSSPLELSLARITPSPGQLQSQCRSRGPPHTKSANLDTRYSCRKCKKYSGENGFKRKDHLVQHLRYSHAYSQEDLVPGFCRHKNCSFAERPMNGVRAFATLRDYTRHLREAHEESLFNCSVPGCRRFGANGYSGWANLLRHVKKNHPRDVSRVIANHDYPLDCLLEI